MKLLQELNEAVELELIDIQADIITLTESCLLIESDSKTIQANAVKFLTKFIEDIKHHNVGNLENKLVKDRFTIFTVLQLLLKHQTAKVTEIPSIKKYLHSATDITSEELSSAEKALVSALSKLKGDHNDAGTKVRDDNLTKFVDDESAFEKDVKDLKTKYVKMAKHL